MKPFQEGLQFFLLDNSFSLLILIRINVVGRQWVTLTEINPVSHLGKSTRKCSPGIKDRLQVNVGAIRASGTLCWVAP